MKCRIKNYIKATLFSAIFLSIFGTTFLGFYSLAHAVIEEYNAAKLELNQLMKNEDKAKLRHHWIKLSDTFFDIYLNNTNWENRPAALFRSAKSIEEMAYRSYVRKDAMLAISRYEILVKNFPSNPLADDSLYQMASIYSELLQDNAKASNCLKEIQQKYTKSDSFEKASAYLSKINGNAVASLAPTPVVRTNKAKISLDNIYAKTHSDVVKIIMSTKSVASWRAKYVIMDEKNQAIIVTLNGTKPSTKISLKHKFERSGILSSYNINYNPVTAQTTIVFKFSDLLKFRVKTEREPAKLIIEATNKSSRLKGAISIDVFPKKAEVKKVETKKSEVKKVTTKKPVAKKPVAKKPLTKKDLAILNQYLSVENSAIKTIVIDPGHGGKDPGAMYNGITEKVINLDISQRLARVLRNAGYIVHLTRTTDKFISLDERSRIANRHKADLFISVHANGNSKAHVKGFETYVLPLRRKTEIQQKILEKNGINLNSLNQSQKSEFNQFLVSYVKKSKKLALMVKNNALKKTASTGYNVNDGGIRENHFRVLIGPYMPSILVEVGYSSNLEEARRLQSPKYRDALAEGIANGLHQYASTAIQANK